jgi:hypothetical protein
MATFRCNFKTISMRTHRIVLVNFFPRDLEVSAKAGFHAELGYVGNKGAHANYIPCSFQRPLYEYDVYVYNGTLLPDLVGMYPEPKDMLGSKIYEPLSNFERAPWVRIAFLGADSPSAMLWGGIPFAHLAPAHEGVTELIFVENNNALRCPELETCIAKMKAQVAFPIHRYILDENLPKHPFYHFSLISNRNHDLVGTYGTSYIREAARPVYVILPQFKDNAAALVQILDTLAEVRPELFPDRPGKKSWFLAKEFAFAEELAIDAELAVKEAELAQLFEWAKTERVKAAAPYEFMRKILVATEDPVIPLQDRLSTNIMMSLQFLDFKVTDIDSTIRGAIKKEDYWAEDADFLAIVEVTATKNKNPKTKEFNDILGRMTTLFKRRDLVLPNASDISGLLILNYDLDTHPFKRPRVYTGDTEEIVRAAEEQNIGLLSTVELYKILIAVKEGKLSKEGARSILKQPGRIEFKTSEDWISVSWCMRLGRPLSDDNRSPLCPRNT